MKKITSIAALLTAMIMLVSCGGFNAPQANPEQEIRTTVSEFFNAVLSYDFDKAKSFTADDDAIEDIESSLNLDKLTSSFDDASGGMFPSDKVAGYLSSMVKKLLSTVKYDIQDVDVDGDTATAKVTMSVPDFNSIDPSDFGDLESIMKESLGFDITDTQEFMAKYAERKGVAVMDLYSLFASGDQSALMNDLFDTFGPEFEKFFDLIGDAFLKASESAPQTESDAEITLEKGSDNTWKIAEFDD